MNLLPSTVLQARIQSRRWLVAMISKLCQQDIWTSLPPVIRTSILAAADAAIVDVEDQSLWVGGRGLNSRTSPALCDCWP